jgi:hypothetical protein
VNDVDEHDVSAISDTNATANTVDEDSSFGKVVGITAFATDGDATDSVTYSLSNDAGGLFDIDANTGVVTVAGALDYETDTSHTIEVTATSDDGSTSTQTFAIGVNDVNETILIVNNGFESQALNESAYNYSVDGWTINNGRYSGVYDPRSSYANGVSGENVAYLYEAGASLEQTLNGYTYSSNEKMIFTVDIGIPDYSNEQDYKLEIVVDSTVVGTHTGSTGASNTLQTATVESSVFDPTLDGHDVTFRVVKLNEDKEELYIDNVQAHFATWADGEVEGTSANDVMSSGYFDSGGDTIDGADGTDDIIFGNGGNDLILGGAGNDTMYGGDEGDIFVFREGDGADTVYGGSGGGWIDTIELSDAGGDLGTYGTDWTVLLTSGFIDAQDVNSLTLSDDADGMITLADGSTIDFYEIERTEW